LHFAARNRAGMLDEPISERALAVVDVSNDTEIANVFFIDGHTTRDPKTNCFAAVPPSRIIGFERNSGPLITYFRAL
jgi:hypothetical protein